MRGHIRRRGQTWYVVVDIGRDENGKRRQKWHSGYRTKREASEALTEILSQVAAGVYVAPSKLTVSDFLVEEWLPAVEASLRPLTFESYAGNIRRHVVPRIGSVRLQQLTPAMLNTLYGELRQDLAARTVRYIHATLRRAFSDAIKWNRLSRNPADASDPPSPRAAKPRPMRTWSAGELRSFLQPVRGDRLFACWLFLATTGCRRGEALGLRWRDIDLDGARATFVQTLVDNRRISAPKSDRGRRSIALDPATLAAVREHRVRQAEERLALGPAYEDADLVFCREDGQPLWPRSLSRAFERHACAAGLREIRLHDLRHTHATLALQAGVHPKVVQERLGHSTTSITLDVYSHAIPAMQEEAAAKVAALVTARDIR